MFHKDGHAIGVNSGGIREVHMNVAYMAYNLDKKCKTTNKVSHKIDAVPLIDGQGAKVITHSILVKAGNHKAITIVEHSGQEGVQSSLKGY
ncbi:hypothetical protein V6N13_115988 [Hibiscus sabdariffa]